MMTGEIKDPQCDLIIFLRTRNLKSMILYISKNRNTRCLIFQNKKAIGLSKDLCHSFFGEVT